MCKRIFIVQSVQEWVLLLKEAITNNLPQVRDHVSYSGSFDHVLDLIPNDGEILVITSDVFHDMSDENRAFQTTLKALNYQKNGDLLSQMIKEKNDKARVYVFSQFKPDSAKFLDGHVLNILEEREKSIHAVLELIEREAVIV